MDLLSAVRAPRQHTQLLPDCVDVESTHLVTGLSIEAGEDVLASLTARGHHNVSFADRAFGVAQFISVDPDSGLVQAVSDPRKYGQPAAMV